MSPFGKYYNDESNSIVGRSTFCNALEYVEQGGSLIGIHGSPITHIIGNGTNKTSSGLSFHITRWIPNYRKPKLH